MASLNETVTASDAKRKFGRILETAIRGGTVVITKHDAPKAVLISMDQFDTLSQHGVRTIDRLTREFDAMYERMQTPKARAAMRRAFDASPEQLRKAAVAGARRRR